MKIIATNLRHYIDKSNLSVTAIARRMKLLQNEIAPKEKKITRWAIYCYLNGHTPPSDRIYLLAAVLGVHPKKLYSLVLDDKKMKEAQKKAKELF